MRIAEREKAEAEARALELARLEAMSEEERRLYEEQKRLEEEKLLKEQAIAKRERERLQRLKLAELKEKKKRMMAKLRITLQMNKLRQETARIKLEAAGFTKFQNVSKNNFSYFK